MRVLIYPMASNTANLAGDSGISIPMTHARYLTEKEKESWVYFCVPVEWGRVEEAVKKFWPSKEEEERSRISLVPLRWMGRSRHLSNHFFDIEGLWEFNGSGRYEVDVMWTFVPEIVPHWKAFRRQGYSSKDTTAPTIAQGFSGIRGDYNTDLRESIVCQGVGFLLADKAFWETTYQQEISLRYFGEFLSQKAVDDIRKKSEVVGCPVKVDTYKKPEEKSERFVIVWNQKMTNQKRPDVFFGVTKRLNAMGKDFEVWVFGEDQRKFKAERHEAYTKVLATPSREEYLDNLSRGTICLAPTMWDGWARSYVDCLLMEIPIICERKFLFADLFPDDYPYFVESQGDYLKHTLRAMKDRKEVAEWGKRLREIALKRCDVSIFSERFREVSRELFESEIGRTHLEKSRTEKLLKVAREFAGGPFEMKEYAGTARREVLGFDPLGSGPRSDSWRVRVTMLKHGYRDLYDSPVVRYKRGCSP
jgi:hypothetical protein